MPEVDLGLVVGPQGPQGVDGPEGPQGIQGPSGPQGEPGPGTNPNLLDNWYFADPINQKMQTEYSGKGYAIDRWYLRSDGSPATNLALLSDGVRLSRASASGATALNQRLEFPNQLLGKQVTISALVSANKTTAVISLSLCRSNGVGLNSNSVCYVNIPAGGTGLFSATAVLPSTLGSYSGMTFGFFVSNNVAVDFTLKAVKLELGDRQTLAYQDEDGNWVLNDPLHNKALELAKCQRYYMEFGGDSGAILDGYVDQGTPNQVRLLIPLPTTMRAAPAVTVSGDFTVLPGTDTTLSYTGSGRLAPNGVTAVGVSSSVALAPGFTSVVPSGDFTESKIILDANL